MRNFYVTFDYKKNNIEMAINVNAVEGVKIDHKLSPWTIIAIVVGCLLFICIVAFTVRYCMKKRQAKKYVLIGGTDSRALNEP